MYVPSLLIEVSFELYTLLVNKQVAEDHGLLYTQVFFRPSGFSWSKLTPAGLNVGHFTLITSLKTQRASQVA